MSFDRSGPSDIVYIKNEKLSKQKIKIDEYKPLLANKAGQVSYCRVGDKSVSIITTDIAIMMYDDVILHLLEIALLIVRTLQESPEKNHLAIIGNTDILFTSHPVDEASFEEAQENRGLWNGFWELLGLPASSVRTQFFNKSYNFNVNTQVAVELNLTGLDKTKICETLLEWRRIKEKNDKDALTNLELKLENTTQYRMATQGDATRYVKIFSTLKDSIVSDVTLHWRAPIAFYLNSVGIMIGGLNLLPTIDPKKRIVSELQDSLKTDEASRWSLQVNNILHTINNVSDELEEPDDRHELSRYTALEFTEETVGGVLQNPAHHRTQYILNTQGILLDAVEAYEMIEFYHRVLQAGPDLIIGRHDCKGSKFFPRLYGESPEPADVVYQDALRYVTNTADQLRKNYPDIADAYLNIVLAFRKNATVMKESTALEEKQVKDDSVTNTTVGRPLAVTSTASIALRLAETPEAASSFAFAGLKQNQPGNTSVQTEQHTSLPMSSAPDSSSAITPLLHDAREDEAKQDRGYMRLCNVL